MTNNTTAALTDEQRKAVEFAIELIENDRGDRTVTSRTLRALLTSPRAGLPRHVLSSLECTAVWLEKGNDPQDAARELRACLAKIDAAPAAPVASPMPDQNTELARMTRMFHAACADLGLINEALGLDPDDGGAEPILDAIQKLKDEHDQCADAGYAAQAVAADGAAKPSQFFVYDAEGCYFETFATDAERDKAHRDLIAEYRVDARQDQEWPDAVAGIISGIVTHTTSEAWIDNTSCDYEPRAAVSLATAESKCTRCGSSTAQACNERGCFYLESGNGEPATADERAALLQWATEQWDAEVKHRPLINVHRRSLDDTWRQVIRYCGGDDVSLLGPRHDALLAANPINTTERDPSFIDNDLDFEPDAQHAVADMANIGYALMQAIERMAPGYCWNESPTEIVSDLINERDEARASRAAAPAEAREPHADDVAVDEFSIEMKAKMAAARAKGRSGWETCTPAELSRMLREHVEKGDPRDVANFCMMLHHHGASISGAADAGEAVAWVCSGSNDFAPIVRDRAAALKLSQEHGDGKIVALGIVPDVVSQGAQGGKGGEA